MFRHLITEKKSTSYPSFIYSCSVGQILQHEIFCLGRLGSSGSKEKKVDFEQLLRVGFSTFLGQNKIQNFFKNILETASKSDIKWLLQFYFYFLKKAPSKVAQNNSNPLFFPYCLSCPNGPNRRILVPKCGLLYIVQLYIKFIYSEKATKFCEIFTLLLTMWSKVR